MSCRENISYLVARDPSIKCWSDRVKLPAPCTKNLIQLGLDELEKTMGGKIKVYLRLKPSVFSDSPYSVLDSTTLQTEAPKESVSYKNVTNGIGKLIHKFTFTSILDQSTTQSELFKKCVVKSLKKFLSGENYLLMAYGTTSAGKTYTMQGNVENPGVIPRALDFVFTSLSDSIIPTCKYTPYQYNEFLMLSEEQLKKNLMQKNFILSLDLTKYQRYPDTTHMTFQTNSSSDFSDSYENVTFKEMQTNLVESESFEMDSDSYKYSVWISMVEIYNEQVYDLLELPNEKGSRSKLTFRDDVCGNMFVKNLRYVNVSSGHEAFQILQFGRSNLHLAPTALNHRSSRSHCIFTITLAKFFDYGSSSNAIISRFSFCDLAGMERAKKTLNVKDRLVESKAINTSLSILVKCLTTIKENQNSKEKKMIPYRESKLTKYFRDAVLGKEQFSLIVNVTTEPNLFDETLNVLKFSAIAQKIVPQNVFNKPKIIKVEKRSRFSRIVVNSSYNSKIIDWDASTEANIKLKEEISSTDSDVDDYKDLAENLQKQLTQERKRCEQIEIELREELTGIFSEILKKQNETHQVRLESERERLKEMYEKKERRLVHYCEILRRHKRSKLDDDLSDYEEEENKLRELEKDAELLKTENGSLKGQVQELLAEKNKLLSECSELKFKLVEKDRALEAMKRMSKANESGGDALEKELQKQLDEANAKLANFRSLLDEAAVDYKDLEESNKYLRNENEILEQHLAEHREMVSDLRNENTELQKMLSHKRILVEKLEEANEKIREELNLEQKEEEKNVENMQAIAYQKEVEILREQLKKTVEWLDRSRVECEEVRGEKLCLNKDLEIAKLKIADLQSKILSLEENSGREEEMERRMEELQQELEKLREFESAAEELSKEKVILEGKCKELEAEVKSLQKEVKDLIGTSKKENEKSEVDALTKENENYQKELLSLKKRNAELEEEIKRLSEDGRRKAVERESKIAVDIESFKKPETESSKKQNVDSVKKQKILSSQTSAEDSSSQENSPFVNINKKFEEGKTGKEENTPESLTKQIENLSIYHTETKSTRKKVDLLEETIHPSTIKNTNKGRKKKENGKKEKEVGKAIDNEKENILAKKKGKCYKKLFTDNDFDGLIDLINASPLEGISRLRPRK